MNRRLIATLIRVRQEVWKRVERLTVPPQWNGSADTVALLDARVVDAIRSERRSAGPASSARASDPLAGVSARLRASAQSRYPRTHLTLRDRSSLVDADDVMADADRLLRGDWDVLGRRIRVSADTIDWRAHPLSGAPTPSRHFSQVSYAADALGGDVKFLWELNRHTEPLRLAQAYWLSRRPSYAEAAVALLESWLTQNPPGFGINWISALDVAFRSIAWCWVWQLTSDSDVWTDARVGRLLWYMAHAGRFISRYDSVHHSPNTHLTGEALGLVYIGTVFPELRAAAAFRALGVRILDEEASHQFLADGMHYERCTGYHRYHLEFYLHALAIARSAGEQWADRFSEHASRAADVSFHLRRSDGSWPVLGDEDGGSTVRLGTGDVTDQSELLVAAAGLLARPGLWPQRSPNASALAWWILGDAEWRAVESARRSTVDAPKSASFSTAGYFCARDDWSEDAWYCLVDAGPHGGDATGHAHTDLGHTEIARGRTRLVVDPGCSVYTSEPALRDWYRGQQAHAGVTVDGIPLARPGSTFGWESIAPTPSAESADAGGHWHCRLEYAYPTSGGDTVHERQVVLIRGQGVVVCDLLVGSNAHSVTVRWPLNSARSPADLGAGESTLAVDDCRITWSGTNAGDIAAALEPTRRSPKFGVDVDASALVVTCPAAALPCAFVTAFTPLEVQVQVRTLPDAVEVTIPASGRDASSRIVFRRGSPPRVTSAANEPNVPGGSVAAGQGEASRG